MTLNMTFFVQVIHFGIGYFFLKFFIIKPALLLFLDYEKKVRSVEQHNAVTRVQIQEIEMAIAQEQWDCLMFVKSNLASEMIEVIQVYRGESYGASHVTISAQEKSRCEEEIVNYIVASICEGRSFL